MHFDAGVSGQIVEPQNSELLINIAHQRILEVAESLKKFKQLREPIFNKIGCLQTIYGHISSLRAEQGSTNLASFSGEKFLL